MENKQQLIQEYEKSFRYGETYGELELKKMDRKLSRKHTVQDLTKDMLWAEMKLSK